MSKITKLQLKRVQVLYSQFAARSFDAGPSREARIAWASEKLGRSITSFSDLSKDDAHKLIDTLQGGLGIAPSPRRRRPRTNSQAAGTEGRRDNTANMRTMPTQEDWDRIQNALTRLQWSTAQYEAWLRSVRSPLARKMGKTRVAPTDITLRTLHDTNRVWWALKQMLKARGLWTA
jgi:hypothetical protein